MVQHRYWVVSPNVDNCERTTEGWTRIIIEREIAIMGYGPDERTGEKKQGRTGPMFAGKVEPGVHQGDVILIARSRKLREVVGTGIVAGEPTLDAFPQLRKKRVQFRELAAFKDLREVERPKDVQRALGKALPWRGAMRELRDSDDEDGQVRKWLDQILQARGQHGDESRSGRGPRQPDIERRHAVEKAAQKAVEVHYSNLGYEVTDVSDDKRGYDLMATKNGDALKIEVKGHSASASYSELTPNEYEFMHREDRSYRLCIVSYALYSEPKRRIQVFELVPRKRGWFDQENGRLAIKERIGARVKI